MTTPGNRACAERGRGRRGMVAAAAALLIASAGGRAAADFLMLRNGDSYTGTVTSLYDNRLVFQSAFGAALTIPRAEILVLETDHPVRVVGADGRTYEARIARWDAGGVVVRRADGTEERLSAADIDAVNPPSVSEPGWSGYTELGAKTTHGNKDTEGFTLGGQAIWKGAADTFTFKSLFRYSEVDRHITERSLFDSAKYDVGLRGAFYGFGAEETLADKFKDLRLRSISSAGFGYTFVQSPSATFSMEGGYAWVSEHFIAADNARSSSLRLSGALKLKLSEAIGFEDSFQAYPSLERNRDYKGRNEASLITKLDTNWGLRIGTILDYDSRPPSRDIDRVDLTHLATIQYRF